MTYHLGTENEPALAADIARLGPNGGTLYIPPGSYQCTNLSVPANVTLRGSHSTLYSVSSRLHAAQGSGLPCLSIKGVSGSHLTNVMLEDLSVMADGVAAPAIDTAYTSYLRFYRCQIGNSQAPAIQLLENWDSRIFDCDFEYCGTTNGSAGAINCLPGSGDFTNSLVVENCRFESFFSSAIRARGNSNKIFAIKNKMESQYSRLPFIDLDGCVHVELDNQLTIDGTGTTPSMVSITNCYGVYGRLSFERAGPGITFENYMNLSASQCIDLKLMILAGASEPTAGRIVKWDGANPGTTSLICQSQLTSPLT